MRAAPDDVAASRRRKTCRDPDVIARLRRSGRQRAPPDRAVPADGGRHPRHQPEGVERLEGQAARRPVPAARCARSAARAPEPRRRDRGAQARGARAAGAARALPRHARRRCGSTLDVSYFMRHDAAEIAWHTRTLSRHVDAAEPVVRARLSPVGEGLQVLVYAPDRHDLFARICGYFDSAGFSILDAKVHTAAQRLRARHLPGRAAAHDCRDALPRPDLAGRDRAGHGAAGRPGRCPSRAAAACRAACSSFPITPRVTCGPTSARSAGCSAVSRQRPLGPAVRDRARAGQPPHQPAARQDHDAGRARRGHLPDRRPRAAAHRVQLQIETELLDAVAPLPQ